jgi:hypothetical protein
MKRGALILTLFLILFSQASAFEFCEDGNQGGKYLRLISVDDMLKENPKEWKWESSQKIEIEARVENRGSVTGTYILEATFRDNEGEIKIIENEDDLKESFSLSAGERKSISLNFQIKESASKGEYNLYIKFYKENSEDEECIENSEEQIKIEKIELCEYDEVDKENLEIESIMDNGGDNENEWEWTPSNKIEISVELNNQKYSERNFAVELIMLDEENNEISFAKNSEDIEKNISIGENESKNINFIFTLQSDIGEGDYKLYTKVYDENNESICTTLKAQSTSNPAIITIEKSKKSVAVTEVIGPEETISGSKISYNVTITNLGSSDEERVSVVAYNNKLNIKEKVVVKNLNSGETENTILTITIPTNSSLARYPILFSTEYEYDEKIDYFRSSSKENEEIKYYLEIIKGEPEIIEENETIEIEENEITNEAKIETIVENKTAKVITTITGNAVGSSSKTLSWAIGIGLLTMIAAGTFILISKRNKLKYYPEDQPIIRRRYTARLGEETLKNL